jgi:hypothetical protein
VKQNGVSRARDGVFVVANNERYVIVEELARLIERGVEPLALVGIGALALRDLGDLKAMIDEAAWRVEVNRTFALATRVTTGG